MQCHHPQWRWGNNSCFYFPFGSGWGWITFYNVVNNCIYLVTTKIYIHIYTFWCISLSVIVSCSIFYIKFYVFFQYPPLHQSARYRAQQSTGRTSLWPVNQRKDPQNQPLNGKPSALKMFLGRFHQRRLKVCIITSLLLSFNEFIFVSSQKGFLSHQNAPSQRRLTGYYLCVAEDGVLSLFNISRETSGFYICTSKNRIGESVCNITLSVMPGKCLKWLIDMIDTLHKEQSLWTL